MMLFRRGLRAFKNVQEFESAAIKELSQIANSIDSQMEAIDAESVELHEGVLQVDFPKGTFVVNKHSASGQIWYSSPISPPAYFDPENGWISKKLSMSLRDKFSKDIFDLTGHRVCLNQD